MKRAIRKSPAVLLLHGFPTSSHMYRELIPALADRYHVVAPDLPDSASPRRQIGKPSNTPSIIWLEVMERFTEVLGLRRYALYVFDYGAPVGFRLAMRHPERITALISQNGNAYEEGLSEGWNPIQAYWKNPSPENRSALRAFLTPETTQWQYTHGAANPERLSPDAWTLDSALLARPGNDEIQLDLFGDYQSNVALYPEFQEYFRTSTASASRGVGQERSILSACRCTGLQTRQPTSRSPSARCRSFCPGESRLRDRSHHPRFPRPRDLSRDSQRTGVNKMAAPH